MLGFNLNDLLYWTIWWGSLGGNLLLMLCLDPVAIFNKQTYLTHSVHSDTIIYSWLGFLQILDYVPRERERKKNSAKKNEPEFVTVKMLWWLIGIILGEIICKSSNWQHRKIEDHYSGCKLATF